jgi:dTDP-glucose 4,6-dehydratase
MAEITFWQDRPVLVTGAGGFIASHLIELLVSEGAQVRAFVRYNSRNDPGMLHLLDDDMARKLEIISGDLRDADATRAVVAGMDTVFHLGALIAIPYSYLHPREVVETNVLGTLNILQAARTEKVRRVIHTSTSEVYGTAQYVPIDESHPLQGQSPYSASKIGADRIAESFYRSYDLPVATLRPFNTYGPRQSARAVIPTIITQALTGSEVRLGSLEPVRDFTYVTDTAQGFLKIAMTDAAIGQEFNLGSGVAVSIGELVEHIFKILGKQPKVLAETERLRPEKSEVMRLHASNRKAQEVLGWYPQVSLDEGLSRTIDWISQNLHRYKPEKYAV